MHYNGYAIKMQAAKNLYRLVTGTTLGAFIGTLVGMVLLGPVAASIAVHPLPARVWQRFLEVSLVLACLAAAYVWGRTSPTAERLKPKWMPWSGATALCVQMILALAVMYLVLGNAFGWLHPLNGPSSFWPPVRYGAAPWVAGAIAAAVGIFRDRWWAFFLEPLVIWSLIAVVFMDPTIEHHPVRPGPFPWFDTMNTYFEWGLLVWFTLKLFGGGLSRLRDKRA